MGPDRQFGRRTFDIREALEWARSATRPNSLLQQNPVAEQDTAALLYAERPIVAAQETCFTTFGGDLRECVPIAASLHRLFAADADTAELVGVCTTLPVDILVVQDIDPAWRNHESWVWRTRPVFANEHVRMFRCR